MKIKLGQIDWFSDGFPPEFSAQLGSLLMNSERWVKMDAKTRHAIMKRLVAEVWHMIHGFSQDLISGVDHGILWQLPSSNMQQLQQAITLSLGDDR